MNIKLRCLVRTQASEQYALYDLDRTDEDYDPLSIGKLDVHYTTEGVYGTLLFWDHSMLGLPVQMQDLATAMIEELCEPMGVPTFYAIEMFCPSLNKYALLSNEPSEGDAEAQKP